MKTVMPLMFFFLFSFSAFADEFTSRVELIEEGEGNLPHLIKLENGRVVFLDEEERELITDFEDSQRNGDYLEVVVDNTNSFVSAETVENENSVSPEEVKTAPNFSYDPTVLGSYSEANSIFSRMRRNYQNESQCYNRAHIWAYEEYKRSNLNSMKLFLFFTNRYIRNYRYQWWFHVSPMVLVNEGGASVERVLDRRYTTTPRFVNSWTNIFIYSGRKCPVVQKYNDYRNNQEKEDCYLIPVSMYFWQPRDIVSRDNNGYEKKSFIKSEVDWAYWEAF
ncbi:protein-glutamine glutaminase family protein [Peredibacter starrii]|uniref:Protein-glutamine glutaminase family protein n=1 Tax=Peredibacter starrii TaxID=28202 RepID=A0AAX4HUP8_9BACT|nr:protein-glutamine glutaminase family protein [Peredibacter starrii]WPU66982.1 protein-glutamine glutaminase family protein [Peredibacter starrii]